jgi:hypothetical protein
MADGRRSGDEKAKRTFNTRVERQSVTLSESRACAKFKIFGTASLPRKAGYLEKEAKFAPLSRAGSVENIRAITEDLGCPHAFGEPRSHPRQPLAGKLW